MRPARQEAYSDFACEMTLFLAAAARAYRRHPSPIGRRLCDAIANAAGLPCAPQPAEAPACGFLSQAFAAPDWGDGGLRDTLTPVLRSLPWQAQMAPKIGPGFERLYAAAEVVGPNGMIASRDCRFGVFVLAPGTHYPAHAHAAEELYLVLSGTAQWLTGEDEYAPIAPGGFSHHLPRQSHATRTGDAPLLALWGWTGNLDTGTYRMVAER